MQELTIGRDDSGDALAGVLVHQRLGLIPWTGSCRATCCLVR